MEDERLPVVMQAGQGLGGSQWEPKLPLHSSRRLSSSQSLSSTAGSTSTGINKNNTSSSQLNLSVQGGGGGGGGGGASPATATNTFEVHQSTVTSQEQQQQPFFDQNTGIWWAADGLHYWDGNQWTLATIGTTLNESISSTSPATTTTTTTTAAAAVGGGGESQLQSTISTNSSYENGYPTASNTATSSSLATLNTSSISTAAVAANNRRGSTSPRSNTQLQLQQQHHHQQQQQQNGYLNNSYLPLAIDTSNNSNSSKSTISAAALRRTSTSPPSSTAPTPGSTGSNSNGVTRGRTLVDIVNLPESISEEDSLNGGGGGRGMNDSIITGSMKMMKQSSSSLLYSNNHNNLTTTTMNTSSANSTMDQADAESGAVVHVGGTLRPPPQTASFRERRRSSSPNRKSPTALLSPKQSQFVMANEMAAAAGNLNNVSHPPPIHPFATNLSIVNEVATPLSATNPPTILDSAFTFGISTNTSSSSSSSSLSPIRTTTREDRQSTHHHDNHHHQPLSPVAASGLPPLKEDMVQVDSSIGQKENMMSASSTTRPSTTTSLPPPSNISIPYSSFSPEKSAANASAAATTVNGIVAKHLFNHPGGGGGTSSSSNNNRNTVGCMSPSTPNAKAVIARQRVCSVFDWTIPDFASYLKKSASSSTSAVVNGGSLGNNNNTNSTSTSFGSVVEDKLVSHPFGSESDRFVGILYPNGAGDSVDRFMSFFLRPVKNHKEVMMGENWARNVHCFTARIKLRFPRHNQQEYQDHDNPSSSLLYDEDIFFEETSDENFTSFNAATPGYGFINYIPLDRIPSALGPDGALHLEIEVLWDVEVPLQKMEYMFNADFAGMRREMRGKGVGVPVVSHTFGSDDMIWELVVYPCGEGEDRQQEQQQQHLQQMGNVAAYIRPVMTPAEQAMGDSWSRTVSNVTIQIIENSNSNYYNSSSSNEGGRVLASKILTGGFLFTTDTLKCGFSNLCDSAALLENTHQSSISQSSISTNISQWSVFVSIFHDVKANNDHIVESMNSTLRTLSSTILTLQHDSSTKDQELGRVTGVLHNVKSALDASHKKIDTLKDAFKMKLAEYTAHLSTLRERDAVEREEWEGKMVDLGKRIETVARSKQLVDGNAHDAEGRNRVLVALAKTKKKINWILVRMGDDKWLEEDVELDNSHSYGESLSKPYKVSDLNEIRSKCYALGYDLVKIKAEMDSTKSENEKLRMQNEHLQLQLAISTKLHNNALALAGSPSASDMSPLDGDDELVDLPTAIDSLKSEIEKARVAAQEARDKLNGAGAPSSSTDAQQQPPTQPFVLSTSIKSGIAAELAMRFVELEVSRTTLEDAEERAKATAIDAIDEAPVNLIRQAHDEFRREISDLIAQFGISEASIAAAASTNATDGYYYGNGTASTTNGYAGHNSYAIYNGNNNASISMEGQLADMNGVASVVTGGDHESSSGAPPLDNNNAYGYGYDYNQDGQQQQQQQQQQYYAQLDPSAMDGYDLPTQLEYYKQYALYLNNELYEMQNNATAAAEVLNRPTRNSQSSPFSPQRHRDSLAGGEVPFMGISTNTEERAHNNNNSVAQADLFDGPAPPPTMVSNVSTHFGKSSADDSPFGKWEHPVSETVKKMRQPTKSLDAEELLRALNRSRFWNSFKNFFFSLLVIFMVTAISLNAVCVSSPKELAELGLSPKYANYISNVCHETQVTPYLLEANELWQQSITAASKEALSGFSHGLDWIQHTAHPRGLRNFNILKKRLDKSLDQLSAQLESLSAPLSSTGVVHKDDFSSSALSSSSFDEVVVSQTPSSFTSITSSSLPSLSTSTSGQTLSPTSTSLSTSADVASIVSEEVIGTTSSSLLASDATTSTTTTASASDSMAAVSEYVAPTSISSDSPEVLPSSSSGIDSSSSSSNTETLSSSSSLQPSLSSISTVTEDASNSTISSSPTSTAVSTSTTEYPPSSSSINATSIHDVFTSTSSTSSLTSSSSSVLSAAATTATLTEVAVELDQDVPVAAEPNDMDIVGSSTSTTDEALIIESASLPPSQPSESVLLKVVEETTSAVVASIQTTPTLEESFVTSSPVVESLETTVVAVSQGSIEEPSGSAVETILSSEEVTTPITTTKTTAEASSQIDTISSQQTLDTSTSSFTSVAVVVESSSSTSTEEIPITTTSSVVKAEAPLETAAKAEVLGNEVREDEQLLQEQLNQEQQTAANADAVSVEEQQKKDEL